jgi:hypothetical protein
MIAMVGMAGLLLIIAIVSGWRGTNRLTSRSDDTEAVEQAATAFVEAYGTFDFRDPESYQERLLTMTTGPVRSAVLESDVDSAVLGQQRTTTAKVTSVEITALSDEEATTSVTSEQARRVVDPASGTLLEERVVQLADCRLVKEAGRWLIAEFHFRSEEPQTSATNP